MTATTDSQQELSEPAIGAGLETADAQSEGPETTEAVAVETADASSDQAANPQDAESQPKERPRREPVALEVKAQRCEETAKRLVDYLGLESSELAVSIDGEQLVLSLGDVTTKTERPLEARSYEAIQFFVSKAMNKGAARRTRLSLRATGFRGRSKDGFGRVAAHLAHKARKLNLSIAVSMTNKAEQAALRGQLSKQSGISVEATAQEESARLTVAPAEGSSGNEGGSGRRRRRRRRR